MLLFLDALTVVWNNLYPYIDRSLNDLLKSTVALFVVIDPIGSVPLFIALTKDMKSGDRKRVSTSAIITAASLLVVFAIAGTQILSIFGITIFSFMIAGGVLLFIVSIELLTHGAWRFGHAGSSEDSGVVPLAFPLLAGPGAITSVIISFQSYGLVITMLSIAIVIGITYVGTTYDKSNLQTIRQTRIYDSNQSICSFYSAIAVQYIIVGIKHLI